MQNRRKTGGFTMAELLIVVAIITILSSVGFVAVQRYQRGLAQVERDAIAKEIFVAAQNHLTMADSQGYLGLGEGAFGTKETGQVYYYAVNGGDAFGSDSALDLMLPFASVDETVRVGGSYVIRYNKNPAVVLDVFYCTRSGTRFGHDLKADDYSTLIPGLQGANKKGDRRKCLDDGAVLGWYGGEAGLETGDYIATPTIKVKNAERLTVDIAYENQGSVALKLIVSGVDSHAQAAFTLSATAMNDRVTQMLGGYTVVLDDVVAEGMRFVDLNDMAELEGAFIPGENVIVKAVAFSNSALTNIAYSSEVTVNSLFADIDDTQETAMIGNFRHLENLDEHLSGVDHDGDEDGGAVKITKAKQLRDLSAPADAGDEPPTETEQVLTGDDDDDEGADLSWPGFVKATGAAEDGYRPVSPDCALEYDGQGHSITGVKIGNAGDAGLFGTLTGGRLSNIELIDFDITGTNSAGALAGTLTNNAVTNVVAHSESKTVTATGPAGGLIGSLSGGTVDRCAAAMIVSGTDAGGLIGRASGKVNVTASYSGGHTNKATYYGDDGDPIINVTGTANAGGLIGDAGGLIGDADNAAIENSYSTCSVKGATAGGLLGAASGSVSKCYATGLVTGVAETSTLGAFAGSFAGTATDCKIYAIINEGMASGVEIGVKGLDDSLEDYNGFVGDPDKWGTAKVYDTTLTTYFGQDKYSLKTVDQPGAGVTVDDFVSTHYGDWPAPELFVVNTAE